MNGLDSEGMEYYVERVESGCEGYMGYRCDQGCNDVYLYIKI